MTGGGPRPPGRPGWFADEVAPGDVIRHPGARTVGPDEHVWLAWITENASDVHGNVDSSSRGPFGGPVVLGALTVAIVAGLAEPGEPALADTARAAPGGWLRITLGRVVQPGDTLHATSEILSAGRTRAPSGATVRRVIRGRNQHGDVVTTLEEERWVPARARWKNDC